MNIQPLQDYVVVKPDTEATETESGIIIPEGSDKEAVNTGTLIAVGKGINDDAGILNKKVLFRPYGFDEVTCGDEKVLIGKAENIMAVLC